MEGKTGKDILFNLHSGSEMNLVLNLLDSSRGWFFLIFVEFYTQLTVS